MSSSNSYYLTTPIYYVNARPHIGHAYTTIVADVLARRHRLLGDSVYFLTGTDEHGQKIERSAAAAGIPPQQFADQVSASFSSLWTRMGITHDQFIRTTSPAHQRGVQQLFRTLYENGHIQLASYTGSYCVSDETFVDLPAGAPCPDCGRPLETVTEENFFFKLSNFQLPLLNLIESGELAITPDSRKNEVLSFLRGDVNAILRRYSDELKEEEAASGQIVDYSQPDDSGILPAAPAYTVLAEMRAKQQGTLKFTAANTPYLPGSLRDLSISRSSFTWGIPVPNDIQQAAGATQPHVIYVWLDALANYITALGYGSEDDQLFQKFWPANLHLVGKEIIRFHCVYWPAFLLAANLPLPKAVSAHGWLLFDDSKMSKSKGNIVRTETILDAFGTLCPPPPVILSEAQSAQSKDPDDLDPANAVRPFQPRTPAPQLTTAPLLNPTPKQNPVILSEAQSAQSKDPDDLDPASAVRPFQPQTPFAAAGERKGTPSGVPQEPQKETGVGASAPTPHDRDLFAADVLRYFLLREIPFGQDGSFIFEALITRYNADLANGYGNLVSRTLKMIGQNFLGSVPEPISTNPRAFSGLLTGYAHHKSANLLSLDVIATINPDDSGEFKGAAALIENADFSAFASLMQHGIKKVDSFLSSMQPWNLAKSEKPDAHRALRIVLYTAAESIRIITALLYPILPYATASVWRQLGLGDIEQAAASGQLKNLTWGGLKPGTRLGPLAPVFPRADKSLIQKMTDMENSPKDPAAPAQSVPPSAQSAVESSSAQHRKPLSRLVDETAAHTNPAAASTTDPAAGPRTGSLPEPDAGTHVAGSAALTTERPDSPGHATAPASGIFASQPADFSPQHENQITIDDFARVELRVAQVILAERIPKADKLLRLEVDLGYERRQILSGIAEWYTPEDLLGRRIVVITNLAPRKMRGLDSHGMLLAASSEGGKPALATFDAADQLPLGSRLK